MIRLFVGTNVSVYASRNAACTHRRAIDASAKIEAEGGELCVTRPRADAAPQKPELAVADLRRSAEIYPVLEDSPAATEKLLKLMTRLPGAASGCTTPA